MCDHLAKSRIQVGRPVTGDQGLRVDLARRLAEEEDDFRRAARRELDRGLKRAAGIEGGADPLREKRVTRQRGRVVERAVAPQEFPAVAGPCRLPAAQVRKGDTGTERQIPGVAREHRAGQRIDIRHDGKRGGAARRAEHPLDIGRDRKPADSLRGIPKRQPRDLDRILERHVLEQLERDTVRGMLEPAVSLSVRGDVGRGLVADRQRRRAP